MLGSKKISGVGGGEGGGYLSLPCGGGARDMFLLILLCKFKIEPPPPDPRMTFYCMFKPQYFLSFLPLSHRRVL